MRSICIVNKLDPEVDVPGLVDDSNLQYVDFIFASRVVNSPHSASQRNMGETQNAYI